MLVLSRRRGQSIVIGDDIVVTVVNVHGDKIRIGIEAPPSVPVHREEIAEAIDRSTQVTEESSPEVSDPPAAP